jgi:hypothetical protein
VITILRRLFAAGHGVRSCGRADASAVKGQTSPVKTIEVASDVDVVVITGDIC